MTTNDSLINLDGITKVFFTDEVETHALSGILVRWSREVARWVSRWHCCCLAIQLLVSREHRHAIVSPTSSSTSSCSSKTCGARERQHAFAHGRRGVDDLRRVRFSCSWAFW